MKNFGKRLLSLAMALFMVLSLVPFNGLAIFAAASETAVAKVGNTEYTTIDKAIANWTNNSTLTLLADVTLSDVVTLNSTEHHILNLGTYTMTAASGKNAFVIKACGTGSAERSALTVNADAANPGGINAGSKSVVYYKYADGGISTEDRPIIKINGGVFTGSTSSWGTAGIYTIGTAARKCATLNITGGTFNCSINGSGKSKLLISGGTFNYSVGSQGDSTALRLISGGKFKTLGFMTADSNNTKFWFGTSMGNSNVGLFVDANGYLNVGGPVITEVSAKYPAVASNATKWSSYLAYSSANTYGLFYENAAMAIAKHGEANVTLYTVVKVTPGDNVTESDVVTELTNNKAIQNEVDIPDEVEKIEIVVTEVTEEKIAFDVSPKNAEGEKVSAPSEAITFRLPIPAEWAVKKVNVYHDGTLLGVYGVETESGEKYVEITSQAFSEYAVEAIIPEAKIGDDEYDTLQAALDAAVAGTGNVTVEILQDVDLTNVDWNPVTVSGPGYPLVTVNGNNKTITGLNDMLFAATWAGKSGLIINDLTIKDSHIVNDKDDAKGNVGVGAFIGYPQASATITLNNCHLVDSTVEGGHWTGGLIGMAGGYNGNDGPVFMDLTITGCSVTGSTITGKGSAGGVIGHGSCADWTNVVIKDTTVSGNTITSTGSSTNKAGSVMGTIGAAGKPVTAAGETKTGGAFVAATTSDNVVTSNGTTITTIYGRQGSANGMLTLTGGAYDAYPIEENVPYAAPADGYKIAENADGSYGLVEREYVAEINGTKYETLQAALDAAGEGDTVKVLADIELTEGVTVAADKQITLDLNGKTVSMETADDAKYYLIYNKGDLTITDSGENGKLSYHYTGTNSGDAYNTVESAPGSVLTVQDGTIENLSANCLIAYAIDGLTNGSAADVTVNIEGGKITSKKIAARIFANSTTKTGTLNISGGEISGRVIIQNANANANKAVLNITGGTFNTNGYKTDVLYVGGSEGATTDITASVSGGTFNGEILSSIGKGFITGGTFNAPVAEELCAEGYIPVDNGDGTYTVKVGKFVAQVGETMYESLDEAINAAKDTTEKTVTVLKTVVLTQDGTLDLQGVRLNAANTIQNAPVFRVLADVTVKNGIVDGRGPTAGEGGINCYAFIVGNSEIAGSLTITDGTYRGVTSAISITNGTVNISGGTFQTGHDNEGTDYGTQYLLNCMDAAYKNGTAVYHIIGGKFVGFNPEDNAAEGANTNFLSDNYKASDYYGDNKWHVAEANVVMDDNKYFTTIKDALATLASADTTVHKVKVLKDLAVDVNYSTYNYPILVNGFAIELDLNGKTLTADWSQYTGTRKDNALIGVCNGGKLDVIDSVGGGKIVNGDDGKDDVQNRIFWIMTSTAAKSIVVNINAGTFVQEDNINLLYVQGNKPSDNLAPIYVNVNGGHFEMANESFTDFFNSYDWYQHNTVISGGTFNVDPTDWETKFPEGYKAVDNGDGTYTVVHGYDYGTWGGIDWKFYKEDGTLVIAPTKGTPVADKNSGKTYEVGEWREAVRYDSKGNGVAIEGWPYTRDKVKTLIIEEGVTSIGSFAAQGFTNLTGEVVIPSTVTYIGQEAFQKSTFTKLTFAAGGTEELCIAQGAFKNLIIEEVALPDDRPVHLHAWVFNNCHNLKHATLPATLVSVHGTNHIDYFKDFNAHSNPTWTKASEIFAYNENMETITFGSEAVRDMFYANNNGSSKDYTVANVGLTTYFDLQDAVDAAQNGETVKLIKTVTVSDTVNIPAGKTVILDLNGKTLTGSILAPDAELTVQNGKIVNKDTGVSGIEINAGKLTLTNVNVDSARHALRIDGAVEATINGGTYRGAIGEGTGTYHAVNISGAANVTIKTGTFVGPKGTSADSGAAVNVKDGATVTIEGGDFSGGKRNTLSASGTIAVSGGIFDQAVAESYCAEGYIPVDNGDGTYGVEKGLRGSGTEEDPFRIKTLDDLILFRDSVNAGETKYNAPGVYVALTADIDMAGINWVGIGSATAEHGFMGNFDGKSYKIKNLTITDPALDSDGYAYAGLFGVTEGVDENNQNFIKNLTIENVTISTTGHIVAAAIAYPYYTTVDNITVCGDINITGGNYTSGVLAYTRRCVNANDLTVSGNEGSTITGRQTVGGVISDIQMNGGLVADYSNFSVENVTITGTKSVGGISGIISNQTLNGATVKDVTLVCDDDRVGVVAGSLGAASTISDVTVANVTGATAIIGGDYDIGEAVEAKIGDTYYKTLADAVKAANAGDIITLLVPYVVKAGETVNLDLKGATIVGAPSEAKAYAVITNYGNLTITDSVGGGAIVCDHQLTGSTGYAVNTIVNSGTLTIEGGIVENKSTASNQIGYAIDNNSTSYDAVVVIKGGEVKASGSNYYDAIRLFCNSLTNENAVTVEGGTVSSIWLQNPSDGATEEDTKEVKGSVSITGGTVNALYLEPSSAFEAEITDGYVGKVEYFTTSEGRDLVQFITGGTFGMDVTAYCACGYQAFANTDDSYTVRYNENIVAWNMQTGVQYETVQEALLKVTAGQTVQMIKNSEEPNAVLVVFNGVTLDLNGKTLTACYAITTTTGSNIIDSTNGNGLLKVAKDNLVMVKNSQIMVWKAEDEGYRFATATFASAFMSTADGNANFAFYLNEKGLAMQELADGADDGDGLSIQVKITYTNTRGYRTTLYLDLTEEEAQLYAQGDLTGSSWIETKVNGVGNFTNVQFSALLRNGNVVIEGPVMDY